MPPQPKPDTLEYFESTWFKVEAYLSRWVLQVMLRQQEKVRMNDP